MEFVIDGRFKWLLHEHAGSGSSDPWVTDLKNQYEILQVYNSIGANAGAVSVPKKGGGVLNPADYTIETNRWPAGVDAIITTESGGIPTNTSAYTLAGVPITCTLNVAGNYTLNFNPSAYPVDIVFFIRIRKEDSVTIDEQYVLNRFDTYNLTEMEDMYTKDYTGRANYYIKVNAAESGVEAVSMPYLEVIDQNLDTLGTPSFTSLTLIDVVTPATDYMYLAQVDGYGLLQLNASTPAGRYFEINTGLISPLMAMSDTGQTVIGYNTVAGGYVTPSSLLTLVKDSTDTVADIKLVTEAGTERWRFSTDAGYNYYWGYQAGDDLVPNLGAFTGIDNYLIGYQSGYKITDGIDNIGIGHRVYRVMTTGSGNIAIGTYAGWMLTSGIQNVIISPTTVAGGYTGITTGNNNIIIGNHSGSVITSGYYNIVLGKDAYGGRAGYNNIALGHTALGGMPGAYDYNDNVAIGAGSMYYIVTGPNVAIGTGTLGGNASTHTGEHNVAIGYQSMLDGYGDLNVGVGSYALHKLTSGDKNTAVGTSSLHENLVGIDNTAIGNCALYNCTGDYNTALGSYTLNGLTTGAGNTGFGQGALLLLSTTNYNVGLGYSAMAAAVAPVENTVIGAYALYTLVNGDYNVAIGAYSGYGVAATSDFNNSVLIGYKAGYALTSGGNNILIGYQAGDNLTTGASNIIIAYDMNSVDATDSNKLIIGHSNFIYGEIDNYRLGLHSVTSPTAFLHIGASSGGANVGTAPLKIAGGTLLATEEAYAVEVTTTHIYWTNNAGTRFQLDQPLVSPTLTGTIIMSNTIQIQDTSADHQYLLAVNELTADRTVTLPLLTGNDEFVFKDHTQTLTNKRITGRVTPIASAAEPTINTDNCDCVTITALAAAITSMTTNLSGTPTNFQKLLIRFKDDGTARAIAWGASYEAKGVALPTTTVLGKVLTVGLIYDTVTSKWGCVATAQEA